MTTKNYLQNVQAFNRKHGKRHNPESDNLLKRYQECAVIDTEETLTTWLMVTEWTSLYDALDVWNYNRYLETLDKKTPVEVVKPEKSVQQEIPLFEQKNENNATGMTLGILEQTLATVIADKYVPVIANQVISQVNDYVQSNYGRVEQAISFTFAGNKLEEITHDKFETIFQFILADEPVMLVGPAGSGKNHIVQQIAKLANLPFYFTNAVTQEYKLTGFIDAMGKYHETEFYKAFSGGGIFMLDEMDASIPEVLIILNAAISNRYFDFPNGRINAHPDFRIIAAGNTFGQGASFQYVGRNQLDGASLNRFAIIEIGYSKKIENGITNDIDLVDFIRDFRNACEKSGVNHIVSYREIIRSNKMLQSSLKPVEVFDICLIKNLEKEDLKAIKMHMNDSNKYFQYLKGGR